MKLKLLSAVILSSVLIGCADEVNFDTQEENRRVARENSNYNAKRFIKQNPEYASTTIRNDGDSTIGKKCAQGDGWSSITLRKGGRDVVKLKCSTVSESIGCLTKENFATKDYSSQDGKCDTALPTSLRPIES